MTSRAPSRGASETNMPFLRRPRETIALGGQQAQRLQQLRQVSEAHVKETHLELRDVQSRSPSAALSPIYGHSARASRTVEAIIESRALDREGGAKATRLRGRIKDARGGVETERLDEQQRATRRPMGDEENGTECSSRPRSHNQVARSGGATRTVRQMVATMRRRGDTAPTRRKLTREELEWIERQLQFTQRVALLEKECTAWWQAFYASAAGSVMSGGAGGDVWVTTAAIQKQVEECEATRREDGRELMQQVVGLKKQAEEVMQLVHQMRDGVDFVADLQDAMDAFETALGRFRVTQREQFDAFVLEEKLIERDLTEFLLKVESWEQAEVEKKKNASTRAKSAKRSAGSSRAISSTTDRNRSQEPQDEDVGGKTGSRRSLERADGEDDDEKKEVDLVKRVRQLNNQIMLSGGLKGGWDDREHAIFTSTLLKCGLTDDFLMSNIVSGMSNQAELKDADPDYEALAARFIRKCVKAVVTKTENAVRHHFDWYLGYLQLIQEKKEVIQRWKMKKEADRQQLIQQGLHQVNNEEGSGLLDVGADFSPLEGGQSNDGDALKQRERESKERDRKARELEKWRQEKERRAKEKEEQEREQQALREAQEAKKRQELLEKKQQIMLYKLQKEQEGAKTPRTARTESHSPPPSKEELAERSRRAIELAKAKREKLQALEGRRQRQLELPQRPKSAARKSSHASSPTDSEKSATSPGARTLLKATKAYEARQLSKLELKRKEKERAQKAAHEAYFPGAAMVSDVKLKSFGHIAIAPRAVPNWRRNV